MASEGLSGAEIAEAYIRIRPRVDSNIERDIARQVDPALKKAGRDATLSFGEALSAGAFVAFVAKITTSAAELEQQVGGSTAVFGRYEDSITRFAEGADEAAGLSEQAARRLTSQIGGLLQGFGFTQQEAAKTSVDLAQLGADLSATYGGTAPQAVEALGAALRGEFDPLEHFGVSLNAQIVNLKAVELGLAKSTGNVSQHAKAQAALAIIMERSGAAQGQFAREADTAAGSASIAQAKLQNSADDLGKSFLPIYTRLAQVVGGVSTAFSALPEPLQVATVAGVGFAALAGPFAKIKATVDQLRASMAGAGADAQGLGAKIGSLAKAGVVAAGISSIVSNLNELKAAGEKAGTAFDESLPDPSKIDDFIGAVNRGVDEYNRLGSEIQESANGGILGLNGLAAAGKLFGNVVVGVAGNSGFEDSIERKSAALDALKGKLEVNTARAEEMRHRVELLAGDLGVSGTAVKDFVAKFAGLDITQVPLEKLEAAFREAQKPGADMAKVAELLGVKVETAGQKAEDAAKRFSKTRDTFLGVVDAQRSLVDANDRIVDAQRGEEEAARRVVDAQRSYQDSLKAVRDAERQREQDLRGVADAQRAVTDAQLALDRALSGPDNALDVESSQLALERAQERLGQGGFETDLDRREAELAVKRAESDLLRTQEDVANRAANAQQNLTDAQQRLDDAQVTAADSADAVTDAQRNVGVAAQGVSDAERGAVDAHKAVEDAQYNAAKASIELRDRQVELWGAAVANNAELGKLRDYLIQLQTDFPATAAAVQPLVDQLNAISPPQSPKDLSPEEFADKYLGGGPYTRETAEKAIQFKALELGLPLDLSLPEVQGAIAQRIQPRATGGPVKAGQPYKVGERGRPELFVPNQDGRIEPAGAAPSNVITLHQENHFNEWPTDQAMSAATDRLTLLAGGW